MKVTPLRLVVLLPALFLLLFHTTSIPSETAAEAGKGPRAAQLSPDPEGRLRISKTDRCPVCGMYPAKRPKHAAGLILTDHRTFYFCGNGCLLRSWREPSKYLGVAAQEIRRIIVLDYFTGAPLDARTAFWVAGSDVVGPMGSALVTLKDQNNVTTFKKRHGGQQVFRLDQLDDALWEKLF